MNFTHLTIRFLLISYLFVSCTKEETVIRSNNTPPKYSEVSTIMVENYVNRLFIDVLGREATDLERSQFVLALRKGKLNLNTRDSIVKTLQFDTIYRVGDSSYRKAYTTRIYNISKSRFLEGAADMDIAQRSSNLGFAILVSQLDGDSIAMFSAINQKKYYDRILKSNYWFSRKSITYNQMCEYMLNNGIYDLINMGSFNFVNATFDDVFGRKPNNDEFNRSFQIIEKNIPQYIFNRTISNKNEFCEGITTTSGFYEAEIRWWYFQLIRREINPTVLYPILAQYLKDQSVENMQRKILISDEYAQF
jgi:hypothetical protein